VNKSVTSLGQSPDFGFPKAERIRKRAEYLRIQSQGRKLFTKSLIAFTTWSEARPAGQKLPALPVTTVNSGAPAVPAERLPPGPPRLGITVSKRVGVAVVRTRVKRLLREVFRQNKERLPPGLKLVIVAKAEAAHLTYQQTHAEFLEICRRCAPRS